MQDFLKKLSAVLNRITLYSLWLSGVCLVGMTVVIAYQVFGRYVLNATPSWAEALSVSLMGWFIFLGAAVGVRERTHLGFDVLLYVLPPSGKAVLRMIADIAVFAFGGGMIYFGASLTIKTWSATRPTLGIPDGVSYFPLVLGGMLICLFTLDRMVERLAGLKPDADETIVQTNSRV